MNDDVLEPTLAYVPSERVRPGAVEDTNIELRSLEDGRLALVVFSSLEELVAGCGDEQPWIGIPGERLEELRAAVEADVIVVDPVLLDEAGHVGGA